MTAVDRAAPTQAIAQPDAPGRLRRLSGALALVVAPWGFVIANASYAWMIRNGGSDSTGAEALALAATGPDLLRLDSSRNDWLLADHPGRDHGLEPGPTVSVGLRGRVADDHRVRVLLRGIAQQHDHH